MNEYTVSLRDAYITAGFSKKSYPAWVRRYFSKELPEFPGVDSLKCGNFYVSLKRVYGIISSMEPNKKTRTKVNTWLSEASRKLNAPNELPLFSVLNNPLFKECFGFMMDFGKYHNNINGMSYTAKEEQSRDLSKRQKVLFENMLNELGNSMCLQSVLSMSDFIDLYEHHVGSLNGKSILDILFRKGFVDASYNGPLVKNGWIDCRILYILIIRHLWR
jgi:hypothetical protein